MIVATNGTQGKIQLSTFTNIVKKCTDARAKQSNKTQCTVSPSGLHLTLTFTLSLVYFHLPTWVVKVLTDDEAVEKTDVPQVLKVFQPHPDVSCTQRNISNTSLLLLSLL